MKMRSLLMGLLIAASAQGAAARADNVMLVDIKLPSLKDIAEIRVDGSLQKGPYDSVRNKTLDYTIAARGERHKKMIGGPIFSLSLDIRNNDADSGGGLDEDWRRFPLTADYIDPRDPHIEGRRISPIDLCNDRLNAAKDRAAFLKKGATFLHEDAYKVTGTTVAYFDTAGVLDKQAEESETIDVPVKITCMPLDRPRPRENSETKGPPPREGKPMAPTIKKATLRVEPAHVVQDGKFLCPSELRLHGYMETIREFYGKSIFVGPHYLSAMTTLNLQAAGSRNATATYKVDWRKMGGFTTQPNAEPKKQKLTFRFNISDKDGKLWKSVEETVEVSCKKIKVNAPTAGDGMTVNPAN